MASPSSCSSKIQWKHDVFLSFRGEDTRNSFTDHLYAALHHKGIITFRDNEGLQRGKEISLELLEAIEGSRISIIILSKNYASSTWCLDELAKIVECMETKNQTVFPLFFNVDPSEVRKQKGVFKKVFEKHEEDFREKIERVQKWKAALAQVSNLSGWHLQDRSEAELIKDIVDEILRRSSPTYSGVIEDLVGIDSHVREICELLEHGSGDVRFVGICGMGGIGKTTVAKVLYNWLSDQYEGSCFLANVREVFEKQGVVHLQETLLSKVLKETNLKICDDQEGINLIKRRLCLKRVLIIFDDVDDQLEQLEKLAGNIDWFGSGSRIIITTRDEHVLTSHGINNIYKVKGLENDEALKLFHSKAFKSEQPTNDYIELSRHVVCHTNGLPLALVVLGSFLCDRSVDEWKDALDSLRDYPNEKVTKILQISYDGLRQTEKNVFLDIACFFKGKDKDRVIEILKSCSFYPNIGIKVLIEKSMITISNNRLCMHDLLQEMGLEIVREQHRNEPGKWSRLWMSKHVFDVLTGNKGTQAIEGIMLDIPKPGITYLSSKSFSAMSNLRLLKISNVQSSEDLEYLSNALRFLKWHEYPLYTLPPSFHPEHLFKLDMCYSNIKYLWKGIKPFKELKIIKLCYSRNLVETPDFTMVPNLQRLDLEGCTSLLKVHESVGFLKRLVVWNLKNCEILSSFPANVCGLKSLKSLNLHGCIKLDKLPQNLQEVECLEELDVGGTAIGQVPPSIVWLTKLKKLSFHGCKGQPPHILSSFLWPLLPKRYQDRAGILLPPLAGLSFLKTLDLGDCNLFEGAIPADIGSLSSLEELNLSRNKFVSLPESISQLSKLKILCMEKCQRLQSLPKLPSEIVFVGADNCTSLETLSKATELSTSQCTALHFFNCFKLVENQSEKNSLAVALLKRHLQEVSVHSTQFHLCLPEIPKWFRHWSEGPEVKLGLSPNWFNNEFVGFAFCVLFSNLDNVCEFMVRCSITIGTETNVLGFAIPSFTTIDSNHIWLGYVSHKAFEGSSWKEDPSIARCIHANFLFVGIDCELVEDPVKRCGIHLVYKQDLDCFEELEATESSMFEQNHEVCNASSSIHYSIGLPSTLMQDSIIKTWYRIEQPKTRCEVSVHSTQFHLCLPGSEIPKWFRHWSEGPEIQLGLSPNWFNNKFIGFAFCVVFSNLDNVCEFEVRCSITIRTETNVLGFAIPSFTTIESNHIWLGYVSHKAIEGSSWKEDPSTARCIHADFFFVGREYEWVEDPVKRLWDSSSLQTRLRLFRRIRSNGKFYVRAKP